MYFGPKSDEGTFPTIPPSGERWKARNGDLTCLQGPREYRDKCLNPCFCQRLRSEEQQGKGHSNYPEVSEMYLKGGWTFQVNGGWSLSGQQEQREEGDGLYYGGFINPAWMTAENQLPRGNAGPGARLIPCKVVFWIQSGSNSLGWLMKKAGTRMNRPRTRRCKTIGIDKGEEEFKFRKLAMVFMRLAPSCERKSHYVKYVTFWFHSETSVDILHKNVYAILWHSVY
jgi:hypothetical protein